MKIEEKFTCTNDESESFLDQAELTISSNGKIQVKIDD
jgi:hypothetical protein